MKSELNGMADYFVEALSKGQKIGPFKPAKSASNS